MKRIGACLAAFLFAALAFAGIARAQVCTTTCSNYIEGECSEHTTTCSTSQAQSHPSFGAIAYGRKSMAWGYSYNWSSRNQAESTAMKNCTGIGKDCEIMVWFDRKCGAVASRSDSTDAYWGLGGSVRQAQGEALNQCAKDKGKGCQVQVSHCSF